ncbi:MAG: response regulator [Parvularculaceae bacterium]|nr:response regulator [Parvularculaceae bacterium]
MVEPAAPLLKSARIVLADDDPIMRELARERLLDAGHSVRTAADGAEALELLRKEGADLVISDLDMPNVTGYELTQKIRALPGLSDTPVIVITASDSGEAVDRAFAAGATSFLAKPINWTLFNHAVMFVVRASDNQRALRAALELAEAGARFKDGLMSVMSHELRTPLNAIIGFGQILSEQLGRDNDYLHKEYADYVVEGGKRLLNSVSDMLLASDARSGPITINEVDCSVSDLVALARSTVEKAAALAETEFVVALQDGELEICCDRLLVGRALAKLLDNAVKFSPRGSKITIGAALTRAGDLAFLVKDSGTGIAPDRLAQLMQPFAQTDLSLRRSREGLGLGLPLVQAIADAHRATFRLDSTPGQGCRAVLLFPASRVRGRSQARISVA